MLGENGIILEKPRDKEHAYEILLMLSGRRMRVYSGVTLILKKGHNIKKDKDTIDVDDMHDANSNDGNTNNIDNDGTNDDDDDRKNKSEHTANDEARTINGSSSDTHIILQHPSQNTHGLCKNSSESASPHNSATSTPAAQGDRIITFFESTVVHFTEMPPSAITAYIATGENILLSLPMS